MTHDPLDQEPGRCMGCQGYGYIPDNYDEPDRFYRCEDCGGTGVFKGHLPVPAGCTGVHTAAFVIEHQGGLDGRRACPFHGSLTFLRPVRLAAVA